MTDWYSFNPVDTLFFKGAEPMNMGEHHTASYVFPPPAHTISGALRTAVLLQHGISFEDYGRGNGSQNILEAIGRAGEDAPFTVLGPLLTKGDELYIPAPCNWFAEERDDDERNEEVTVFRGRMIETTIIKTEHPRICWAKGEKRDLVSLGGKWIKGTDLNSHKEAIQVLSTADFFAVEQRTGIALHRNRKIREGHLYSFNHARLKQGVTITFGVDKTLPLAEEGTLSLGAEQRFGSYKRMSDLPLKLEEQSAFYMALSVIEGTEEVNNAVVATGKIQYFGGWDLKRGFHKPMKGFFPAGTVCTKKIKCNFIAIQGE